jgi:hypothetical protein
MAIIVVGRSLGVRLSSSLICDLADKASVPAHVYTNCLAEEKVSLGERGSHFDDSSLGRLRVLVTGCTCGL